MIGYSSVESSSAAALGTLLRTPGHKHPPTRWKGYCLDGVHLWLGSTKALPKLWQLDIPALEWLKTWAVAELSDGGPTSDRLADLDLAHPIKRSCKETWYRHLQRTEPLERVAAADNRMVLERFVGDSRFLRSLVSLRRLVYI